VEVTSRDDEVLAEKDTCDGGEEYPGNCQGMKIEVSGPLTYW